MTVRIKKPSINAVVLFNHTGRTDGMPLDVVFSAERHEVICFIVSSGASRGDVVRVA